MSENTHVVSVRVDVVATTDTGEECPTCLFDAMYTTIVLISSDMSLWRVASFTYCGRGCDRETR